VGDCQSAPGAGIPSLYASGQRRPEHKDGADHFEDIDRQPAHAIGVLEHVIPDEILDLGPFPPGELVDVCVAGVPNLLFSRCVFRKGAVRRHPRGLGQVGYVPGFGRVKQESGVHSHWRPVKDEALRSFGDAKAIANQLRGVRHGLDCGNRGSIFRSLRGLR